MKPSIEQSSSEELDQPVTIEELFAAVSSLQSGKSPGPGGYPVEFYKVFWQKLSPLLLDMFNESFEKGYLPQTLNQASISLFLKKEKDAVDCTSFHPINLLNVDFKWSKTLALRLECVLPTIISSDQTGFIQNRHLFSNLGQLFNIIYDPSQANTEEALISMDAEKKVWSSWMGLLILYSG